MHAIGVQAVATWCLLITWKCFVLYTLQSSIEIVGSKAAHYTAAACYCACHSATQNEILHKVAGGFYSKFLTSSKNFKWNCFIRFWRKKEQTWIFSSATPTTMSTTEPPMTTWKIINSRDAPTGSNFIFGRNCSNEQSWKKRSNEQCCRKC